MPMPVILVIRLLLAAMLTLSQWVNGFDPQVFPKIQLASLQMVSNVQRWQQLERHCQRHRCHLHTQTIRRWQIPSRQSQLYRCRSHQRKRDQPEHRPHFQCQRLARGQHRFQC